MEPETLLTTQRLEADRALMLLARAAENDPKRAVGTGYQDGRRQISLIAHAAMEELKSSSVPDKALQA